jgi:transposase
MARKKSPIIFHSEYQDKAVRLAKTPGQTVAGVAKELDIPAWKLRKWVAESEKKLERSSEVDELIKKDNEIRRLKEEIEILKKAAAYFAKALP